MGKLFYLVGNLFNYLFSSSIYKQQLLTLNFLQIYPTRLANRRAFALSEGEQEERRPGGGAQHPGSEQVFGKDCVNSSPQVQYTT
jgi:hypothetical protein